MTRGSVITRDAVPDDAEALLSIWKDFANPSTRSVPAVASAEQVVSAVLRLEADASERLLVAVVDDAVVGVVHLRRAPVSPIHDEDAVHLGYLHVLTSHRRRGVGRQFLEAAADWADEKDSAIVMASVAASARDSNRFLARLGLTQVAVLRACSVVQLRTRLSSAMTKSARTNVVATRRLMRRARNA